jgi:hypothetical protein
MGLVRNRLTRRFKGLGLISDVALVGTAAGRAARRGGGSKMSAGEMAMAGGAALRLVRRLRRRRKAKKAARIIEVHEVADG